MYVSFIEIFPQSKIALETTMDNTAAYTWTVAAFFGGILLMALIDKLVPSFENPHEMHNIEEMSKKNSPLLRMGLFSALAIGIHNFPEGMATFTAALKNPALGFTIAVAIALHNIPEGIAVSVPVYHATGKKKLAFVLSSLSGLAEPVGALIGYLLLAQFFNDFVFGITFAMVAGIMVYISLDELLPAAQKYGEHHLSIFGLIMGMATMAISLLLLI